MTSGPPPPGAIKHVTSLANPIVKDIRALALPKNRKATGLFVAEGLKLVADAIEAGWTARTLVYAGNVSGQALVARLAATVHARGGSVLTVSEAILAKISRRDNPQMVIGVFEQRFTATSAIRPKGEEVWVALEGIRDPGNLGTIVRTADAVGAAGVLLVGETVDPFSTEAVRATMGSIFAVPLARLSRDEFGKLAKSWPGSVVGTHLGATVDYREADYRAPVMLVMGTEQAGLTPEAAKAATTLVKIPMAGKADSLNLAVATAVMLFEIRRKGIEAVSADAQSANWRERPPAGPLSPLGLMVTIAVLIADQAAKAWATSALVPGEPIEVLPILTLYRVENTGIAFSILAGSGAILTAFTIAITAGVILFWARSRDGGWLAACGFAAILGGALGNLIDRVRFGHVVDFLLLHFGDLTLFIFNVAYAALTVGPILLFLMYFRPVKQ